MEIDGIDTLKEHISQPGFLERMKKAQREEEQCVRDQREMILLQLGVPIDIAKQAAKSHDYFNYIRGAWSVSRVWKIWGILK